MTCPSRFELARSATGDANVAPDLQAHVAWCARCRESLAELESSRLELFGHDEEAAARAAAGQLAATARARGAGRSRRWLFALVPMALAAAGVTLWVGPRHDVRAKGDLVVDLYCKRGDAVFPGEDGGDFFPGDRLRFAYTTAEAGYLVVFGVDDRGAVFPYYPARDLRGIELPAGKRVLLPGSIELDAHRGWERAFALWSRSPFDEGVLRTRVGETLRAVGGDLRRAGRLAGLAPQVSYLLRRP